jgi:hypothetical protein
VCRPRRNVYQPLLLPKPLELPGWLPLELPLLPPLELSPPLLLPPELVLPELLLLPPSSPDAPLLLPEAPLLLELPPLPEPLDPPLLPPLDPLLEPLAPLLLPELPPLELPPPEELEEQPPATMPAMPIARRSVDEERRRFTVCHPFLAGHPAPGVYADRGRWFRTQTGNLPRLARSPRGRERLPTRPPEVLPPPLRKGPRRGDAGPRHFDDDGFEVWPPRRQLGELSPLALVGVERAAGAQRRRERPEPPDFDVEDRRLLREEQVMPDDVDRRPALGPDAASFSHSYDDDGRERAEASHSKRAEHNR